MVEIQILDLADHGSVIAVKYIKRSRARNAGNTPI